MLSFFVLLAYN